MKIDEAIAHEKELAKKIYLQGMLCHANPDDGKLDGYIENGRYHERIVTWLEELKMYKSLSPRELVSEKQRSDRDIEYHKGFNNGYNKSIDDFIHECDKYCEFYSGKNKNLTREDMLNIAERLKGKMNNEFI